MIKRPILVTVIGYIIGILMGLYFNFSIVLLYIPITVIYLIIYNKMYKNKKRRFKLISFYRYFRYIKLVFNKKVILIILISSIISNSIILLQNQKYNILYKHGESLNLTGIIVSNNEEKEYKDVYRLKVKKCNNSKKYSNTYLYLNINKKLRKKIKLWR